MNINNNVYELCSIERIYIKIKIRREMKGDKEKEGNDNEKSKGISFDKERS